MQITSDALFFPHALITTQIQDKQKWIFYKRSSLGFRTEDVLKTPGFGVNISDLLLTACFWCMLSVLITNQTGRNKPTRTRKEKKKKHRRSRNCTVDMAAKMKHNLLSFIDVMLCNQGSDANASMESISVIFIIYEVWIHCGFNLQRCS